jgi:hypothetical protein
MAWAAGQIVTADDLPSGSVENSSPDNSAAGVVVTTTPQNGATICGVAFVAPPSGKVRVHGSFVFQLAGGQVYMAPMVRNGSVVGSGTAVFTPSDDQGCKVGSNVAGIYAGGCSKLVDGLTPGASYNVAATFFTPAAGSTTIQYFSRTVGADPLWA